MKTSLSESKREAVLAELFDASARFTARYPGEAGDRQPVHTVYGGAHLFRANTAARLGEKALATLSEVATNAGELASVFEGELAGAVGDSYDRIVDKLRREPVEDFRLDFEDGYGYRPDAEEDATAIAAAREVAEGLDAESLPPFVGIRIKALNAEVGGRSVRTLDLFLTALLDATGGRLPDNFVVTLPKVSIPEQVTALVELFEELEAHLSLASGSLKLELMVETPQSIVGPDGRSMLPALVAAARGRCKAAHFGVYDFTAGCSITAHQQTMDHLSCDIARQMMVLALSGTGVWLSDGATNVMPVPLHRSSAERPLSVAEKSANRHSIVDAWRLHFAHTQHSLRTGFYQGWDLHPGQLVSRYAAVYSFFRSGLAAASARLANFVEQASRATLVGEIFDDAATGQGLLNFFLRALNCGAISEAEALATGLTIDELRTRSFVAILDGRRAGAGE